MSLPLAEKRCGMPPSITPSHAPPLSQPMADGALILSLIQPKNPSKQDAESLQPPPGSSSFLPSPLKHQVQCPQAIHKTIRQFHQHLKAEQLDQNSLQIIFFQHQNDFALMRYLIFSSVATIPISYTSVKNSATSPPINFNRNPNPTSNALLLPCAAEPSVRLSTPEAPWDHSEGNQTTLQTSIFSLQPPHGMAHYLRYRISHQEFLNSQKCSVTKLQLIHLILRGFTISTFFI